MALLPFPFPCAPPPTPPPLFPLLPPPPPAFPLPPPPPPPPFPFPDDMPPPPHRRRSRGPNLKRAKVPLISGGVVASIFFAYVLIKRWAGSEDEAPVKEEETPPPRPPLNAGIITCPLCHSTDTTLIVGRHWQFVCLSCERYFWGNHHLYVTIQEQQTHDYT